MKVRDDTRGKTREERCLPDNIEIGIHLMEQDGDKSSVRGWFHKDEVNTVIEGRYHICDVGTREVFWLEEVGADIFWEDLDHKVAGKYHLRE